MPSGDRTGPAGMGPMTGRGAGFCAGFAMPGYANSAAGRGAFGQGRGFGGGGRGRRNRFYATGLPGWARTGAFGAPYGGATFSQKINPQQELDALKGQAEYFEDILGNLNNRIEELESQHDKNG